MQSFEPVTRQDHAAVAVFAEPEDDGFGGTVEQEAPGAAPRTYRGEILPFEKNLETGELSWAVPRMLDFVVPAARVFAGQVDPQSEEGERALFELALNMGPGGLVAAGRRSGTSLGVFGGRHAKTADHDALARAKEMQKRGASREEIWRETGWFQGDADSIWRYEIDDSAAKFKDFPSLKDNPTKAGEALDHEELYAAYPELKDEVAVVAEEIRPGVKGMYDPATKTLTVSPHASDKRSTALHELQHAVQKKEGFVFGSTRQRAEEIKQAAQEELREVHRGLVELAGEISRRQTAGDTEGVVRLRARQDKLVRDKERLERDALADPLEIYERTPGEREARNVQTRRDFTSERRKKVPPWRTEW